MEKVIKTQYVEMHSTDTNVVNTMLLKALLICGIISSLIYVGGDVFASIQYNGYSYIHQAFSELGAIGSPVRSLMVPLAILYGVLTLPFGIGVWVMAGRRSVPRFLGINLTIYGAIEFLAPFFPMHVRGTGTGPSDILHIILTGLTVLFILLSVGAGAFRKVKWFRNYSIGTITIIILFGIISGTYVSRIGANLPTPWLGIIERVQIYSFMLWMLVLAIDLLRHTSFIPKATLKV